VQDGRESFVVERLYIRNTKFLPSPKPLPSARLLEAGLRAGRRNSKQSQMLKFQMSQTKEFREFEFWKFEFVSDFDIRISDFATPKNLLVPAMPG
jgi:hypothetical protein